MVRSRPHQVVEVYVLDATFGISAGGALQKSYLTSVKLCYNLSVRIVRKVWELVFFDVGRRVSITCTVM
jgi:hypothetical protein